MKSGLLVLVVFFIGCQQKPEPQVDTSLTRDETDRQILRFYNQKESLSGTDKLKKARLLYNAGNLQAALSNLGEPTEMNGWMLQGKIYSEMQRWNEALKSFEMAASLNPDYPFLRMYQVKALHALGETDRVAELLDVMKSKHDLGLNDLTNVIAKVALQIGDTVTALEAYHELSKIRDMSIQEFEDFVALQLAAGDTSTALSSLDRIIATTSRPSKFQIQKGDLLIKSGQIDPGLNQLREAGQEGIRKIADYFYEAQRFDSSAYYYKKTMELNPTDLDAHYRYARSLERRGFWTLSMNEYQTLMNLGYDLDQVKNDLANVRRKIASLRRVNQADSVTTNN